MTDRCFSNIRFECRKRFEDADLAALDKMCLSDKEKFNSLDTAGLRGLSTLAFKYYVSGILFFRHSPHGQCFRACVNNAL